MLRLNSRTRKAIKAARDARGWSQDALGKQLGVSRVRVAQIEQGRVPPGPSILARIGAALDLDLLDNGGKR